MRTKLFFIIFVLIILAGCTPSSPVNTNSADENKNVNTDANINANTNAAVTESPTPIIDDKTTYVSYVNKALGYTISRPDGWYWRHYIKSQIGDGKGEIDDKFVTDPEPLPSLDSPKNAWITIDVYSAGSPADFERRFSDLNLAKKTVRVGDVEATRLEGLTNAEVIENNKVIYYIFGEDNKIYVISYSKQDSTAVDEQIFEKVVSSFKF